jgi:hypothetical protein
MLAPVIVEGFMADGTRGPTTVYVLRPVDMTALPADHIHPEPFEPDFYGQAAMGFEITSSGAFTGPRAGRFQLEPAPSLSIYYPDFSKPKSK